MHLPLTHADIYLTQRGQGESALFLHGVPDSAELWGAVIDGVQHQYRCCAIDLPGFRHSTYDAGFRFEFKHYAELINELVEQLALPTPLTLVVHDWGGIFGLLWAARYPYKVKRIVGGSFPFDARYRWHAWARLWRTPLLGELSMLGMNWPLYHWAIKRSSKQLSTAYIKHNYQYVAQRMSTRSTVLKLYRSANRENFQHWQQRVQQLMAQVPTDLLWGDADPYIPVQHAHLLPAHSLKVIKNCGHWVPREAPKAFIQSLLAEDQNKR